MLSCCVCRQRCLDSCKGWCDCPDTEGLWLPRPQEQEPQAWSSQPPGLPFRAGPPSGPADLWQARAAGGKAAGPARMRGELRLWFCSPTRFGFQVLEAAVTSRWGRTRFPPRAAPYVSFPLQTSPGSQQKQHCESLHQKLSHQLSHHCHTARFCSVKAMGAPSQIPGGRPGPGLPEGEEADPRGHIKDEV